MASPKETRVMIDNVNNSQNSCLIMQMFQIMQKNQAAPAIPVNNAGVLFQMMMFQVVQKMAASMDLFAPVMTPSMLLRTHDLPFVQPGNAKISRWNFHLHTFAFQKIVWWLLREDRYSSLCSVCVVYKYLCEGGGGYTNIFCIPGSEDLYVVFWRTNFLFVFCTRFVYIPFSPTNVETVWVSYCRCRALYDSTVLKSECDVVVTHFLCTVCVTIPSPIPIGEPHDHPTLMWGKRKRF